MCSDKTPRNFIIATWEGGGSVGPKLTLARKLIEAGHRVRVMSDECNRPEAEAVSARFVPWTRAPSRKDRTRESELIRDWAAANPAEGFMQAIDDVFAGPSLAYAQDIMEEIAQEPCDLVITSDLLFGVMAGCEAIFQPFAIMPCNWIFYPMKGAPRSGPGQKLEMTPEREAEMQDMLAGATAMFDHGLPALNTTRAVLGLKPLDHFADQAEAAEKVFIGISRTFDFAQLPDPQGFSYVGPQLDDPAWVEQWSSPWAADDTRPLVLVGFSTTFQNHTGILQRVADALGQLPVRGLLTLGPTIAPEEITAPHNVELVRSAPHNLVMRDADLVVTHGGHGTIARAMANKLPMLVIPHGRDQDGNAARIVEHGAGLTLSPSAALDDIAEAVERLLCEEQFRIAAERLGTEVEREMRQSTIVEELEALTCREFA